MTTVPYIPSPDRSSSPWGVYRRQSTPDIEYRDIARTMDLALWQQVIVRRWTADSEVAPATYQRVDAEPTHAAKFQDGNNRWYEIMPDDGGYVTAAQCGDGTEGLLTAMSISKYVRGTPGYTYTLNDTLTIEAGQDGHFDCRYSNFVKATDNAAILIKGAWINERPISAFSVDSEQHSVLTFAAAAPYPQSALLKVISDDSGTDATAAGAILAPYATGMKAGEFATVRFTAATDPTEILPDTQIVLDHKLLFQAAYVTLPRVAQMVTDGRMHVEINAFSLGSKPVTGDPYVGDLIKFDSAFGVTVDVFSTPFMQGTLCETRGSYACSVRSRHHGGGPEFPGGYGCTFECSEQCWGQIDYCGPIRHVGDGGAGPTGSHSDFGNRGLATDCGMRNTLSVGCLGGAFGTHHGTLRHGYINCTSIGSATSCVGFRGHDNYARSCTSIGDAGGFGQFNQSTPLGLTTGSKFYDCICIDPKDYFVSNSAGEMLVQNPSFERSLTLNASSGLFIMDNAGVETRVIGGSVRLRNLNLSAIFRSGAKSGVYTTRKWIVTRPDIDCRGLDPVTNLPALFSASTTDITALEFQANDITVHSEEVFALLSGLTDTTLFTSATKFSNVKLPEGSRLSSSLKDCDLVPFIQAPVWLGAIAISLRTGIRLDMVDDSAQSFAFNARGLMSAICLDVANPAPVGDVDIRAAAGLTAVCDDMGLKSTTNITLTTGTVLAGTTGSDGNITISAVASTTNRLYIENRSGITKHLVISFPRGWVLP